MLHFKVGSVAWSWTLPDMPVTLECREGSPQVPGKVRRGPLRETLPISHLTGTTSPRDYELTGSLALMLERNPLDQVLEETSKSTEEEPRAVFQVPDDISKQKRFVFWRPGPLAPRPEWREESRKS